MNKALLKNSLYLKLVAVVIPIVIFIMSLYTAYAYFTTKDKIVKNMEIRSHQTIVSLQKNITNFVEAYAINEYDKLVYNELDQSDIFAIIVEDFKMGKILGSKAYVSGKLKDKNLKIVDYDPKDTEHNKKLERCLYSDKYTIQNKDNQLIGKVTIYISDSYMKNELHNIVVDSLINLSVISIALIFSLLIAIKLIILRPITNIANIIEEYDEYGLPTQYIPQEGPPEIVALANTMNSMIKTIRESIYNEQKLKTEIINEKNFISAIVENANSIIARFDSAGTMTKLNQYGQDFTGYSQDEVSSEPYFWTRFLSFEKRTIVKEVFENAKNGNLIKGFRNSWISKDGNEKIFEWSNTLVKNSDGTMDYLVTVGIDVTEQEKQSLLIKHQKEEFETIFKNSKDSIAILDLSSNFLDFNDAYLTMTGYTREELLTKSCVELTIEDDKEKNKEALAIVLKEGFIENFEKSCLVKDDKIITINMSVSLMPDRERLLISAKNITHNKFLESQAKLASMGEMIGNIAHQWRQPLSVINIISSAVLFKHEKEILNPNDIIPNMEKIIAQVTYLSKTIDDFRNFIKSSDEKVIVNLSSVIDKTLSIATPTLSNNHIEAIFDIDTSLEIEGYENGLMQAFINIINNSKDAINENLSELSDKYIFITLHKIDDKIEITFKDNAGGIKPDIINRIFEPYFTTKHKSVGTGLGLSMAYQIITQRHNAIIQVTNETYNYKDIAYTGACFTISFAQLFDL